jgi:hypothetical protein
MLVAHPMATAVWQSIPLFCFQIIAIWFIDKWAAEPMVARDKMQNASSSPFIVQIVRCL